MTHECVITVARLRLCLFSKPSRIKQGHMPLTRLQWDALAGPAASTVAGSCAGVFTLKEFDWKSHCSSRPQPLANREEAVHVACLDQSQGPRYHDASIFCDGRVSTPLKRPLQAGRFWC